MKTYKWFFLIFVSSAFMSCHRTSEEELIGDWQKRARFPDCSRSHTATFVINNKGYTIGGTNGNKILLNDVFVFDHTGGGKDMRGNSLGFWTQLEDFPGPARQQAVGFSLNGLGYIGAGMSYDQEGDEVMRRDFWRYNPADDSWEEIAPLPVTAKQRRAAIAFSLKVGNAEYGYIGCGYEGEPSKNFLLDFWRYDPVNNEWTKELGYGGNKRAGAAVFVIDNKAFICNGEHSQASGLAYDLWMFDPNADESEKWTNLRAMTNANPDEDYEDDYGGLSRAYGVAYVVQVGSELRGHIVGGRAGNAAKNWEYSHLEDLWTERTNFFNNMNLGSGKMREGMISFSFSSGRAFVGLGLSGVSRFDDLWEFVPLIEDYTYDDF